MKTVYIVLLIVAVVVAVIAYAALVVASRCIRREEMQDPCAGCIREHICTDEEKESCPYCRELTREG